MASGDGGVSSAEAVTGPNSYVILVFTCISIYNVIELTFIIWGAFKRHSGLYFWCFMVATYGILIYAIGFVIKAFIPQGTTYIYCSFIAVGWVAMVSGQSLVLWSRLHLIVRDKFRLKAVLWMIIVNAVILHIPTIVMLFGANGSEPAKWVKPYEIYEKIEVTVFFVQEIIISSFYIVETLRLSKLQVVMRNKKRSRNLMYHLILVNILIILLDITILGLEYGNMYDIQTAYKGLVYSIKLKMEFTILNKLVEMTTGTREPSSSDQGKSSTYGPKTVTGHPIELKTTTAGKETAVGRDPNVSYQAYAQGGESEEDITRYRGTHPSRADNNSGVVMTTEIVVQREERKADSDSDTIQEPSSVARPDPKRDNTDSLSTSSSELHLATNRGF
ncbi:unnamed protein product [Clonostachys rosea f. rosea IK726]|uniref:DUF7703 domain-containing protein n=2 Tax=Bionectria ochroleuca TaxID=29856 RepID=A0A0B7JZ94_BIOOC|nr:unnamed protein product [Clonostachys rosea f. rosea IK726]